MSSAQLSLSPETMDEMGYGDMFKIIRVGLNPEGLKDKVELVNLQIDKEKFTFGIRHGVLVVEEGFSPGVKQKVSMSRQQFYDAFFFDKGLPKDTHPVMKLVLKSIESPIGTVVPIVGR